MCLPLTITISVVAAIAAICLEVEYLSKIEFTSAAILDGEAVLGASSDISASISVLFLFPGVAGGSLSPVSYENSKSSRYSTKKIHTFL